jgi:hypothetical protein
MVGLEPVLVIRLVLISEECFHDRFEKKFRLRAPAVCVWQYLTVTFSAHLCSSLRCTALSSSPPPCQSERKRPPREYIQGQC